MGCFVIVVVVGNDQYGCQGGFYYDGEIGFKVQGDLVMLVYGVVWKDVGIDYQVIDFYQDNDYQGED